MVEVAEQPIDLDKNKTPEDVTKAAKDMKPLNDDSPEIKEIQEMLKRFAQERKQKEENNMAEKTYTISELKNLTPSQLNELMIALGYNADQINQLGKETEYRLMLMNQNPKQESCFIPQFILDHKWLLGGLALLFAIWYFKFRNNNTSIEGEAAMAAFALMTE